MKVIEILVLSYGDVYELADDIEANLNLGWSLIGQPYWDGTEHVCFLSREERKSKISVMLAGEGKDTLDGESK